MLGVAGLLVSLLLALALIAATRRQTAHFRSLVTPSTDLVLVFGAGGCRYASDSVTAMLGRGEESSSGPGSSTSSIRTTERGPSRLPRTASRHEIVFRLANRFGEWRHLEAHVTDLRDDRHIRGVVLNARDVTERVRLEEELTRQAFHDGLTGLANRALFRDRLDQALARSERSREPLAVLLIDLDGFKQVNDSLGHDAGDQLLQEVARPLRRRSCRRERHAGPPRRRRVRRAARGRRRERTRSASPGGCSSRLGRARRRSPAASSTLAASIGIVVHPGGSGASEELIRHADVAMYAAKETGRGRYEVFRLDMARELGELLGLEHELRLGLKRGEFSVHYQPEVDLETQRIVGVEALVRWNSPTRGAVVPGPVHPGRRGDRPDHARSASSCCARRARRPRAGSATDCCPTRFVTWVNLSGKQLSAGGVRDARPAGPASGRTCRRASSGSR